MSTNKWYSILKIYLIGYLILHHSVLWPLVSYTPDLVTEAENLVK